MKDELTCTNPDGDKWLFYRVWGNKSLRTRFTLLNGMTKLKLCPYAAYSYGEAVSDFTKLILFLIYIIYG